MLVALDFDGTLATADPFVKLGEQHGVGERVAGLLDRMATGDLDYVEGLEAVADQLDGLPVADAEAAFEHVEIRDSASELLADLHRSDHHVAVISDAPEGAIESCLDPATFDVDTLGANRLEAVDGALTGTIDGPPIEHSKDDILGRLAVEQGRTMDETIAVGDDVRDLPMLQAAGTGIGVDPEPVVETEADLAVPTTERLRLRLDERNVV